MKLKIQVVILMICFHMNSIFSQVYFNNKYDNFNNCDGISSIELKNNNYFSQGFSCVGGIGLNLSYYDLNGIVIKNKIYNIGNDNISPGKNGSISLGNQQFVTSGFINKASGGRVAYQWRFNDNLDSISYFEYGFAGKSNSIHQIVKTSDNKLYMVGFIDSASTNADILIIKTDTSGNEIWKKRFGLLAKDEFVHSIDTLDGKLIISGLSRSHVNSSVNNGFVMCLDTSANIIWQKTINTNSSGDGARLRTMNDHKILIYNSVFNYSMGIDKYFGLQCEKIDVANNSVWLKNFNNSMKNLEPTNVIENRNGNIVIIGNVGGPSFGMLSTCDGFLNEITLNGDSIFFRKFTYENGEQNYAYSIIQSPDNGYCIGGFFIPVTYTSSQDKWLIKLDSNFCGNNINCGYLTSLSKFETNLLDFDLYPNPTIGDFFIEKNIFENLKINIQVFNTNGECVFEQVNNSHDSKIKIGLKDLKSGVYYVRCKTNNQISKPQKIVLLKRN